MSVTLHHLNNSQSQRVLWLLEELGCSYEIVHHYRDPKIHRAPPELLKLHPLGRSPILVTADGRAIAETLVIVTYLLETYDIIHRFTRDDWIEQDTLISAGMTTLGNPLFGVLICEILANFMPWPIRPFISLVFLPIRKVMLYTAGGVLDYFENALGDDVYFGGSEPSKADIMLSFPFETMQMRHWVNMGDAKCKYVKLSAWLARVQARPAYKTALNKGNGYDMNAF